MTPGNESTNLNLKVGHRTSTKIKNDGDCVYMASPGNTGRTCFDGTRRRDMCKFVARRGQSRKEKEKRERKRKRKKRERKRKKGKKQVIHTSENLQEDIDAEGRYPDHEFQIDGLDEGEIRTWWNGFNKTSWSWTQNCCQTVVDGLRIGGSDGKLSWASWTFYKVTALWTPRRLTGYCEALVN